MLYTIYLRVQPAVQRSLYYSLLILSCNQLNQLLEIIDSSKAVNLRKVKIPISISTIIRLKLGDAFLFVVYHNQRHLQQALNLVNNPNFPK